MKKNNIIKVIPLLCLVPTVVGCDAKPISFGSLTKEQWEAAFNLIDSMNFTADIESATKEKTKPSVLDFKGTIYVNKNKEKIVYADTTTKDTEYCYKSDDVYNYIVRPDQEKDTWAVYDSSLVDYFAPIKFLFDAFNTLGGYDLVQDSFSDGVYTYSTGGDALYTFEFDVATDKKGSTFKYLKKFTAEAVVSEKTSSYISSLKVTFSNVGTTAEIDLPKDITPKGKIGESDWKAAFETIKNRGYLMEINPETTKPETIVAAENGDVISSGEQNVAIYGETGFARANYEYVAPKTEEEEGYYTLSYSSKDEEYPSSSRISEILKQQKSFGSFTYENGVYSCVDKGSKTTYSFTYNTVTKVMESYQKTISDSEKGDITTSIYFGYDDLYKEITFPDSKYVKFGDKGPIEEVNLWNEIISFVSNKTTSFIVETLDDTNEKIYEINTDTDLNELIKIKETVINQTTSEETITYFKRKDASTWEVFNSNGEYVETKEQTEIEGYLPYTAKQTLEQHKTLENIPDYDTEKGYVLGDGSTIKFNIEHSITTTRADLDLTFTISNVNNVGDIVIPSPKAK